MSHVSYVSIHPGHFKQGVRKKKKLIDGVLGFPQIEAVPMALVIARKSPNPSIEYPNYLLIQYINSVLSIAGKPCFP